MTSWEERERQRIERAKRDGEDKVHLLRVGDKIVWRFFDAVSDRDDFFARVRHDSRWANVEDIGRLIDFPDDSLRELGAPTRR